jgi:hypothetical protein
VPVQPLENSSDAGPDGLMLGPVSPTDREPRLERLAQFRDQRKPINSLHFTTQPLFDYLTIVIARTTKTVIPTNQSQWTNSKSPPKSNKASRTSAPKTSRSSTSSSSARPRRRRFNPVRPNSVCIYARQQDRCIDAEPSYFPPN